jgi:hypothetical protein
VLFDGKRVELGLFKPVADEFVGPDLNHAIVTLRRLQRVMDNRYATKSPCSPPSSAPSSSKESSSPCCATW